MPTILAPVDLAHARVQHHKDIAGTGRIPACLRCGCQRIDRDYRSVAAICQSLGNTTGSADTGKRARPGAKGNRITVA